MRSLPAILICLLGYSCAWAGNAAPDHGNRE